MGERSLVDYSAFLPSVGSIPFRHSLGQTLICECWWPGLWHQTLWLRNSQQAKQVSCEHYSNIRIHETEWPSSRCNSGHSEPTGAEPRTFSVLWFYRLSRRMILPGSTQLRWSQSVHNLHIHKDLMLIEQFSASQEDHRWKCFRAFYQSHILYPPRRCLLDTVY